MKTIQDIFWNYINSGETRFFYREDLSIPFINGFTLILLGLLIPFGSFRLFLGGYQAGFVLLGLALLLFLNVLYLRATLRAKQAAGIISFLITLLGIYTFWEGSIFGSTGIFWVYPVPVLIFFLSGKSKGVFWSLILLVVLYTLSILSMFGVIKLPYDALALQESFIPLIATIAGLYMYADFIQRHRQSLSERRALNDILLENIGEAVFATDPQGIITKVNTTANTILGWNEGDLVGTNVMESIPCLDQNGEAASKENRSIFVALRKKTSCPIDGYLVAKNGDKVPVAGIVNPIIVDGKIFAIVATFHDTTKEKEMEKMRLDLLSLASHQLRTPLSGTKWLIETLKKGIHGSLGIKQAEYIDEIYKINERMTGLVSDMLSTLRIENGVETFKTETVSIASIFDATKIVTMPAADARKVILHFQAKGNDTTITTIPELLQNILESIISNAINYSPLGKEVFIDFKEEADKNAVIFSVKDSGIGIPKDEQGPIFSRFYRTSNAKTFNTTSSGLGLYMAAMLAKKIDGKIYFESEENKGSTFYVRVPQLQVRPPESVALKKE